MGNVGIYKITSPTGKVYIGQSINIKDRFRHYREVNGAVVKQRKLFSSILKHGYRNHIFETIHELPKDVSQEVLNVYEILYMQQYQECGVELLNIKDGGLNGRHSEETKQKLRVKGKFGKPVSEETRAKMRKAAGRPRPYRVGMKMSEAAKLRMKEGQKNRKKAVFTEAGKAVLIENARKMREKRTDWTSPMKGKHHSQESKNKVSQSKKGCKGTRNKKVICEKTGVIYESAKDAALAIGVKHSTLIARLSGPNKNYTTLKYL